MYTGRQVDRYGGRVLSKKRRAKLVILKKKKKNHVFEWKPANLFEEWSNILMFVFFAKKNPKKSYFCRVSLMSLETAHLIRKKYQ